MNAKPPTASSAEASSASLAVVEEYLRCVREGDRDGLRDILSSHLELRYFGPHDAMPWVGTYRGLRGFDQFARLVVEHLELLESAEIERIVDGQQVVVIGRGRWRVRRTGRELRARAITVFGVDNGRIARYHVYTDTAAFVLALHGQTPSGAGSD